MLSMEAEETLEQCGLSGWGIRVGQLRECAEVFRAYYSGGNSCKNKSLDTGKILCGNSRVKCLTLLIIFIIFLRL